MPVFASPITTAEPSQQSSLPARKRANPPESNDNDTPSVWTFSTPPPPLHQPALRTPPVAVGHKQRHWRQARLTRKMRRGPATKAEQDALDIRLLVARLQVAEKLPSVHAAHRAKQQLLEPRSKPQSLPPLPPTLPRIQNLINATCSPPRQAKPLRQAKLRLANYSPLPPPDVREAALAPAEAADAMDVEKQQESSAQSAPPPPSDNEAPNTNDVYRKLSFRSDSSAPPEVVEHPAPKKPRAQVCTTGIINFDHH